MLGHMISNLKPKTASTANETIGRSTTPDHCQEQILGTITELHALSRRGLWGILLFLGVSALTLYCSEAGLFARVPAGFKDLMGDPPPAHLLHIVLAVSWLSAFVLILGRVASDGRPIYNWCNVGLPTVFYPLYIFSDPSGTSFPAVFAAGLVLLLVEQLSVTVYAARAMREQKALLERLDHLKQLQR